MLVEKAKTFALKAHGNQKYGNDLPYGWHLEHVALLAERLGYPEEVIAACWLHDTIEDTDLTSSDLAGEFPKVVVSAVEAVTYVKESGADKIAQAMTDPVGHVVKYCDAAVNFAASVLDGPRPGAEQWDVAVARYPEYLERLRAKLPTPVQIRFYIEQEARSLDSHEV